MRALPPDSLALARLVIAEELEPNQATDAEGRAALRVCEKLRHSLTNLIGAVGFRLLLARALSLAKDKAPWLGKLVLLGDGVLECPPEAEATLNQKEAREAATSLVAELLGLLTLFIGAALTQQLVRETWPQASFNVTDGRSKL